MPGLLRAGLAALFVMTGLAALPLGSARAQILNIEKKRLERREAEYLVGNVGLNFNYNNRSPSLAAPARVLSTGLTSNLAYFAHRHSHQLINDYQLLVINDSEIVNTGLTHLRTQLDQADTFSWELYAQFQYDRPRGLSQRWLSGGGPRLRLVASDALNVTTGTSLLYEVETWQHPTLDATAYMRLLKSSTYLSLRAELNERVDTNAVVYYQVGYDRVASLFRHRISTDVNLAVKLLGPLSLTANLSLSYETAPVVPIIPLVFATTNGIRLDF